MFPVVWIFLRSLGVICYDRWISVRVKKLLQGLVSHEVKGYLFIFNQFKLMAILPKTCKPDNFESHNSLKLSFKNIWGLHSNFDDCKSFLELNPPEILALCQTNLDESIDSGYFSVRGHSSTHMDGLAVYVKEQHHFAWDFFLENSEGSYTYIFHWLYSTQCLTFFPLSITFFMFVQFLILFHLTLMRFSQ